MEDAPAKSTIGDFTLRQKTLDTSLIPLLLRSHFSTRNAPEDKRVRDSVATDTVRAVDAAGDFARCVETFNRLAVDVHHLRLGVDLQAAHGMVHGGRHNRRPVRAFVKAMLGQAVAATELVARLHLAELIPRSNRLLEILGVDAGGLGKVIKRLAGKRFVLMQKIEDLDAVRVLVTLNRQIRLCRFRRSIFVNIGSEKSSLPYFGNGCSMMSFWFVSYCRKTLAEVNF